MPANRSFSITHVPADEQGALTAHFTKELGTTRSHGGSGLVSLEFDPATNVTHTRGAGKVKPNVQASQYILPTSWQSMTKLNDEFPAHLIAIPPNGSGCPAVADLRKSLKAVRTSQNDFTISSSMANAKSASHPLSDFEAVKIPGTSYTYFRTPGGVKDNNPQQSSSTAGSAETAASQGKWSNRVSISGLLQGQGSHMKSFLKGTFPCNPTWGPKNNRVTAVFDPADVDFTAFTKLKEWDDFAKDPEYDVYLIPISGFKSALSLADEGSTLESQCSVVFHKPPTAALPWHQLRNFRNVVVSTLVPSDSTDEIPIVKVRHSPDGSTSDHALKPVSSMEILSGFNNHKMFVARFRGTSGSPDTNEVNWNGKKEFLEGIGAVASSQDSIDLTDEGTQGTNIEEYSDGGNDLFYGTG